MRYQYAGAIAVLNAEEFDCPAGCNVVDMDDNEWLIVPIDETDMSPQEMVAALVGVKDSVIIGGDSSYARFRGAVLWRDSAECTEGVLCVAMAIGDADDGSAISHGVTKLGECLTLEGR